MRSTYGRVQSPCSDAELLGGMLYSLWAAFPEGFQEIIKKILAKHGIDEVVPEKWYRLQPVMDALKEVEDGFGASSALAGW